MHRASHRFAVVPALLAAIGFSLSGSLAMAKEKKVPDLTKACAKECPNLASNDEVYQCVENLEKQSGEKTFKKEHKHCYKAHEKYEKKTGHDEKEEGKS